LTNQSGRQKFELTRKVLVNEQDVHALTQ